MIGVICHPDETAAVGEFFELFKTPWGFFQENRTYDVLLTTAEPPTGASAKVILVFGSDLKTSDAAENLPIGSRIRNAKLACGDDHVLPIYGDGRVFGAGERDACLRTIDGAVVGLTISSEDGTKLRLGYDLFKEIGFLLSVGQPVEQAHVPALEVHIKLLRDWIVRAGVGLIEIPPVPAGHDFFACLTHDIDFVGIRRHKFDHTMWGFVYRSTVVATGEFLKGRISGQRLIRTWMAVASLPLVYLGLIKDFWEPFQWYLKVEKGLSPTYFFIPFKNRAGENVSTAHAERRASAYDINDVTDSIKTLMSAGSEIGVHGIDAWHSVENGREELERIKAVTGESEIGIRMHWLLRDDNTCQTLEKAGYQYDSTGGYNEAVGYRNGTGQVFRPFGSRDLLEIPLHLQDGALFYAQRLNLTEAEASERCASLVENAKQFGGVLTVLWHDRSPGPERFWGNFYAALVENLKSLNPRFANLREVVRWFRERRAVEFAEVNGDDRPDIKLSHAGKKIEPPLRLRVHTSDPAGSPTFRDIPWTGENEITPDQFAQCPAGLDRKSLTELAGRL